MGAASTAFDIAQDIDELLNFPSFGQTRNALGVPGAATDEGDFLHDIAINDNVDATGADAFRGIGDRLFHYLTMVP